MTLDALWLSSGAMGLLASNVQRRGGLGQAGGSSNEVCPSLTSELEELPLKSDSPSELGRRGKKERERGSSEDTLNAGVHFPFCATCTSISTDNCVAYREIEVLQSELAS